MRPSSAGCCSDSLTQAWSRARLSASMRRRSRANAALRSIVRRDTGESYQDFLRKLAQASGIKTPTRADLARIDRKRKKKGSNDDWTHPHDPDAKIPKMKDGRTHLAHKAEHAVDLETGTIVGVTVQDADDGDTEPSRETLITAAQQIEAVLPDGDGLHALVGDKGYHSNQLLVDLEAVGLRSYISEPDRGPRTGKTSLTRVRRSTAIVDAFVAHQGCACCGSAASDWNGPSPIFTSRVACGACTCAGTETFWSDC